MLDCTTSRHFCIPLNSNKLEECAFVINKSIKDELIKIHEQFAHPSKAKFKSLLVDANMWNEEYSDFANELYEKCEICHGFKVTPPRPVASLSLTNDFNDAVAIDLKHWKNNLYILYMVDIFTKFTLGSFIKDQTPGTIIDTIVQMWIGSGLGSPKKFLEDNGGIFAKERFRDV